MRRQRGLTLIEMMIAMGMTILILIALTGSLSVAFSWQRRQPEIKERRDRVVRFQDRLRSLIQRAYLSPDTEDTVAYFIGDVSSGAGEYADQITFTAVGSPPSGAYLNDVEDDFEGLNLRFGPQGGRSEYGISMVPVGTPSVDGGLYLRDQRPADGDSTQGGYESQLDDSIEAIQFEFFDGTEWIGTWDTREGGGWRRLPAAVRVSYRIIGETVDHILVVRLPHSDVTPDNPITQDTGDGGEAQ
jgi:type II secretory pathway pseudopilin PulG